MLSPYCCRIGPNVTKEQGACMGGGGVDRGPHVTVVCGHATAVTVPSVTCHTGSGRVTARTEVALYASCLRPPSWHDLHTSTAASHIQPPESDRLD